MPRRTSRRAAVSGSVGAGRFGEAWLGLNSIAEAYSLWEQSPMIPARPPSSYRLKAASLGVLELYPSIVVGEVGLYSSSVVEKAIASFEEALDALHHVFKARQINSVSKSANTIFFVDIQGISVAVEVKPP